jgi:hypothetical protein
MDEQQFDHSEAAMKGFVRFSADIFFQVAFRSLRLYSDALESKSEMTVLEGVP